MNSKSLLLSVTVASALLAGCGGGGGGATETLFVAASDTVIAAAQESAAAVEDVPFVFGPVADFGTTTTTTVTFTDASAAPAFSIAADGNTATGETTFGSCFFKITVSTFPAGHRLAVGNTIKVDPCNVTVRTAGKVANGVAESRSVALRLGTAASTNSSVTVNVNAGGQLTLNGKSAGTVTLTPVSGGGS